MREKLDTPRELKEECEVLAESVTEISVDGDSYKKKHVS